MKRIAVFHSSIGHTAKVYKDYEWQEYRVKFYSPEGQHMENADYHTDDKTDALDTARSLIIKMKAED